MRLCGILFRMAANWSFAMNDLLISGAKIWTLDDAAGTLESGWLSAKDGIITGVGSGEPPEGRLAKLTVDAKGSNLMPALADCHTHLMEYATAEVHGTSSRAQGMAAVSNLLTALKCGIVATGEHHLGHPVLNMPMEDYKKLIGITPMASAVSFGCCQLGFEPRVFTSCTRPGEAFAEDILSDDEYRQMARESEFAGENIFLNYTCANAPLEAVPHAGEITYNREKLERIIDIFHSENREIGAHIEGDASARMFIECGGDVIHHGHMLSQELGELIAEKNIKLVITPSAGTSKRPTSPEEAYGFYRQGVFMALASDSYIPLHPAAGWIPLPPNFMSGPEQFLKICAPILRYFVEQGVSREKALALITINGRKMISPNSPMTVLAAGRPADLILCDRLPALETVESSDIKLVIAGGFIQVDRR